MEQIMGPHVFGYSDHGPPCTNTTVRLGEPWSMTSAVRLCSSNDLKRTRRPLPSLWMMSAGGGLSTIVLLLLLLGSASITLVGWTTLEWMKYALSFCRAIP